jgi:hypothetical protein
MLGEYMKIIPFYLPQFHAIPENDQWWGQGFTEWTNVKKAKPLYRNHYQPRVPLNDNYYNLLDENVMEDQMKLAKKYGIGGFCFYHYWFCGKKLLEKPLERLLDNKNADLPYCLAWANEPWTRAWNGKEGEKEVLQLQDYGEEKEWIEHFMYLLNFFKDSRYLCVDGKPVFLIYRSYNIMKCDEMINVWQKLAIENGLKGLYLISMETSYEIDRRHRTFDAHVEYEPMRTLRELSDETLSQRTKNSGRLDKLAKYPFLNKLFLDKVSYDECYKIITNREHKKNKKVYLGAFVDWDNTARKGFKGLIFDGASPTKLQKYLKLQINRSKQLENELLFVNAWNEWSEAAYLEPDKRYGYAYLNAVRRAIRETED